ncbi:MAG TPA: RsmE family RNA methyltransferase [Dehalococcoidales bacterium]|nr:RsmE family RNA methyltransferase [Dehalococcoidales bacterium]
MRHIYVDEPPQGEIYTLTEKERLHHLCAVLRVRTGDEIALFDRQGRIYTGRIAKIEKNGLTVRIEKSLEPGPQRFNLTIACAVPQGSGMDDIVDKLTQLGADIIIPMITERVVASPREPEKKLERWRKIALGAAEQSQRRTLPEIPGILKLTEVLQKTAEYDLKLIPTLGSSTGPLSRVMDKFSVGKIAILIGPEGDFTPLEVDKAVREGFTPVSLGKNVLKVDTAALAVCSAVKLALTD